MLSNWHYTWFGAPSEAIAVVVLGSCRACMAWNTAKSWKWKSEWKTAPSWTGAKTAKKWPQKWKNNGKRPSKSHVWAIFFLFFAIFGPVQVGAVSISISFFFLFHFRLLAVFHAIAARQDPDCCFCSKTFFGLMCWWWSQVTGRPNGITDREKLSETGRIRFRGVRFQKDSKRALPKIAFRNSKCCNRSGKKQREHSKCYYRLGKTA